jgi:hypothetical protein
LARREREARPAHTPFTDVRLLSRSGLLRAALRGLAAALLLVPAWLAVLGPRPVFFVGLLLMLMIIGAAEVALERRASVREWRLGTAGTILVLAWAAPLVAQALDGVVGIMQVGGSSALQTAVAWSAFRLRASAEDLAFHGSVVALATPVVAAACARLWARRPGVRTNLDVGRGMLVAVALAGLAIVMHAVARLLMEGPNQEMIAVLGAIFFGVVLLSPVTMLLGQLAGFVEERLTSS